MWENAIIKYIRNFLIENVNLTFLCSYFLFFRHGGGSYNQVVFIWRKGDVEMMDFKKGLLALSLFGVFSGGNLFASASTLDRIEPQEPLPGFELDLVEYDTAVYNGDASSKSC